MKKLFIVFLSIVFVLLSCASCKTNDNSSDISTDFVGGGTTIKNPPTATETVEISQHIPTMYHANPVNDEVPFISGYDDNNYYWIWYLGDLENVPLQSNGDFGAGASVVYNGTIDFTYGFSYSQSTAESVEKAISNASSKTTEWTTSNKISISDSQTFNIGIVKNTLKVGYARTWGKSISNTETISQSLTNTASKTKATTTTVSTHFDKNCKAGHYRWCLIGDVEVYACIVYNYKDQEIAFCDNIEKVVGTPGYGFEYSQNSKFELDRYDTLPFDCPRIETLLNQYKPTKSIDIYTTTPIKETTPTSPIILSLTKESCEVKNGYNPNTDGGKDAIKLHSKFDMFNLTITGCTQNSGKYTVQEKDKFDLTLNLLQNPDSLPRGVGAEMGWANFYSYYVTNDSYFSPVCAVDPNNQIDFKDNIGKGACYVTVYLKSGATINTVSKTNLMERMNKGDSLSLVNGLDNTDPSKIEKIEILVVYKLKWEQYSGWWYSGYTNWRCTQTIYFD